MEKLQRVGGRPAILDGRAAILSRIFTTLRGRH
jgi:hypothetical protein